MSNEHPTIATNSTMTNRKLLQTKIGIWTKQTCVFLVIVLLQHVAAGQYEDNPLKGKKWLTISTGLNGMDYLSWQGMASYSMRGETVLTQFRMAYSQELIKASNDSATYRLNRLSELGLMWGDGWSGKKWYVTGAAGFGLNVRMFARRTIYEDQYLTAVTLGIPFQIELGTLITPRFGMNLLCSANLNFRAPYVGGQLGAFWRMKKKN